MIDANAANESDSDRPQAQIPQSSMTAEQLLSRLVDFLKDARDFDAIRPATVGTALDLEFGKSDRAHRAIGRLTPDLLYTLELYNATLEGPMLWLRFTSTDEAGHPPMTDICQLDLDRFSETLVVAGYDKSENIGEHGRRLGHLLRRPPLLVEVTARGESSTNAGHACITDVIVRRVEAR